MGRVLEWGKARLLKNQPAEIAMCKISEVQEAPAFNGRRSFLTLRDDRTVAAGPIGLAGGRPRIFRLLERCECRADGIANVETPTVDGILALGHPGHVPSCLIVEVPATCGDAVSERQCHRRVIGPFAWFEAMRPTHAGGRCGLPLRLRSGLRSLY
jgi:hypothetical protein